MTSVEDVVAYARVEAERDAARAALERVAVALGVDIVGVDVDEAASRIVEATQKVVGDVDAVAAPSMRRVTKSELAALSAAGSQVSFDEVPADASAVVDGEPVVIVEVR